MSIGDFDPTASYAGPQLQYAGLDQINVALPGGLAGAGVVKVRVLVDGVPSNGASITFR